MADVKVKLTGIGARFEQGNMGWINARTYWETRPLLLSVLIVVALVSPRLGFFIDGVWPGAMAGLAISVVTFIAGFFATTRKHDEIRSR